MSPLNLWPNQDEPTVAPALFDGTAQIRAHTEYQTDPIGWAEDKLGIPRYTMDWSLAPGYYDANGVQIHEWDGTVNPIKVMMEAIRDWKDCAVEAGTGTNKSYTAAIIILWFLACFKDAEVYTFAPTEDQLKLYIWKNIQALWPRFQAHFPTAELTTLTIRMYGGTTERWSAHGKPVQLRAGEDVATRAAGMHAEHMLLVYEEMQGMDASVPAAGKNTCTAPHNLRLGLGNPNHQMDTLHQMTKEAGVVAVRISALDHPNVVSGDAGLIPGATSISSIERRRIDYGESSPVYQSRVRGISPDQPSDALIRKEWLDRAAARWAARKAAGDFAKVYSTGKGVDAANSEHGDKGAICDFMDNAVIRLEAFHCPDANVLGAQVYREARSDRLDAQRIGVDAIGVGAGTVNELRRLGMVVNAIYSGNPAMRMVAKDEDGRLVEWSPDANLFLNLRAQMYWQARVDLQNDVIDVEYDKELWEELTVVTFQDDGKVTALEKKEKLRKLLHRSPNKADAFVYANWVRARKLVPAAPAEKPVGQSLGFDYAKGRPFERTTAEEEFSRMLDAAQGDPLANRYYVPMDHAA